MPNHRYIPWVRIDPRKLDFRGVDYASVNTHVLHMSARALTRGPVMSPGAIGARQRVATVQALRPLRAVSVRVLHTAVL